MTTTERYAALRVLYLQWYERMKDEYHAEMADYCGLRIAEVE